MAAQQQELRIVADQLSTPTSAVDLAHAIQPLITRLLNSPPSFDFGTYHITNRGVASWYDFATAIVEEATHHHIPLQVRSIVPHCRHRLPPPPAHRPP
ncbi:MAG: sugar nucleotide-binding protein, partial [Leptolyngbyaceae cyanobacterium SL_7_1]|nr:sugar nucleotide-binding protein [Leptolyngbyaceae cyanobacterium SL_7_1]